MVNFKNTITINRLLKNGLPPVVLQMLLQNTANKLDVVCQQAVEDERKQAEEKGKGETNE